MIQTLLEILPDKQTGQVMYQKKFHENLGPPQVTKDYSDKPLSYQELFADNTGDSFRVGISLTGRTTTKLYAELYDSDIIVASPLGLRSITGADGDGYKRDYDFLSSIEMLILNQADVFSMQNWEHMDILMEVMNLLPVKDHDTDFARVRQFNLNGWAGMLRQTIMLSAYVNADLTAFYNQTCENVAGRIMYRTRYAGVLSQVVPQVRQLFQHVECDSVLEEADARFNYFKHKVYPKLKRQLLSMESSLGMKGGNGVLFFVPSYFDFVRLRNFFRKELLMMSLGCEYTDPDEVSRSRFNFFHGKTNMLVITERFHFYKRYNLRGVKNVIFYGLPQNADFYSEIVNTLIGVKSQSQGHEALCLSLYTKYDLRRLERIVSTARAKKLLAPDKVNKITMFA
jgi:U3 small nucleolar RNA-associated protein 25